MKKTFWDREHPLSNIADWMSRELIPANGSVENADKNPNLEIFRIAANAYYDIFNNGGCNRQDDIIEIFGVKVTEELSNIDYAHDNHHASELFKNIEDIIEPIMTTVVCNAMVEQFKSNILTNSDQNPSLQD